MKITEEMLIDQLTEGHLDSQGGYPFDFQWVDGNLVIAEIDHDDASKLTIYTQQQVDDWIADANEYMEEHKCDAWEAIGENYPINRGV